MVITFFILSFFRYSSIYPLFIVLLSSVIINEIYTNLICEVSFLSPTILPKNFSYSVGIRQMVSYWNLGFFLSNFHFNTFLHKIRLSLSVPSPSFIIGFLPSFFYKISLLLVVRHYTQCLNSVQFLYDQK